LQEAERDDSSLPNQEDYDAIVQSIKDYAGGWYDGDAKRMRRCLHPNLVKQTIVPGSQPGSWKLSRPNSYDSMVKGTLAGGDSSEVPTPQRRYQIDVLDVFRHVATARCISPLYVDYLHLAKFGDKRWLIVNAMWELRTGSLKPVE
jgi:putative lumazine-binding protein